MVTGLTWRVGLLGALIGAVAACGNDPGTPSESQAPAGGNGGTDSVGSSGGAGSAAGASATGGGVQGPSGMAGSAGTVGGSSGGPDVMASDGGMVVDAGHTISPASGTGTWTDLARMPGGGRGDGSGAVVGGLLLVVGGQGAIGQDVEAYDPKTNTWETQVKMPVALNHANVAGVGDKLYVMGGRDSTASYVYNPLAPMADRKWTTIATIPGQRESSSVGVISGKIYLAGGAVSHTDPPRGELFVYDPATDQWDITQPALPVGRTHAASAVINDVLYIAAGRIYAERLTEPAGWIASTYAYDPKTKQWTKKKDAPTARSGCVGAAIKGLLIVAGGEGAPTGGGTFPQVEAYNPDTDEWTTLTPMKHPRNGQAQVGIDDKLYTAGGTGTDITDVFTLP